MQKETATYQMVSILMPIDVRQALYTTKRMGYNNRQVIKIGIDTCLLLNKLHFKSIDVLNDGVKICIKKIKEYD